MTIESKVYREPVTGYGEFQDLFEYFYNELVDNTIEENPDQHDTACDLAEKFMFKAIRLLGYEIVRQEPVFISLLMIDIRDNFYFYNPVDKTFNEIFYCKGNVCVKLGEDSVTLHSEYVFADQDDAVQCSEDLSLTIPHGKDDIKVLAFRHGGDGDHARAVTIEEFAAVDRVGFGVFVRKTCFKEKL